MAGILPLVIETGESFLTNRQIVRHIRDKCGDAMADYIAAHLGENRESAGIKLCLQNLRETIGQMESDIEDIEDEIRNAKELLKEAEA